MSINKTMYSILNKNLRYFLNINFYCNKPLNKNSIRNELDSMTEKLFNNHIIVKINEVKYQFISYKISKRLVLKCL